MTKSQDDDLEAVRKIAESLTGFDPADQERIVRWAREKVGLPGQTAGAPATAAAAEAEAEAEGQKQTLTPGSTDIKSFVKAKNPSSDTQFTATVAYFYKFVADEHLRKESITGADLQEACRLVDRNRLNKPSVTLNNAHKQGVVDRGERGTYAINTVGENLVAIALPAGEGRASPAPTRRTAKRKRPTAAAGRKGPTAAARRKRPTAAAKRTRNRKT